MKYPQLVSTRAVNAISEWLVARLEQLGVEAPLIYSRLLLSLLQSSVQINDPIEFNNLETFLANRKGFSKRYPSCDTNTLRKITAVQCLMEIVSSEQEITKIENLVDELCVKVNDIEKQSTNLEESNNAQVASLSLSSTFTTSSSSFRNNKSKAIVHEDTGIIVPTLRDRSTSRNVNKRITSDKEDLRNCYYRAFPALSKEMENSVEMVRRNIKSLTWPVDRKPKSSPKTNSINEVTIAETSVPTTGVSFSTRLTTHTFENKSVSCNAAVVKRKTKRRRNQGMAKGRLAGNNIRKNSFCGGSSSPTWDTDFEGSWEMGRDLIKEFIVKQNNRNRSTSESAAYNMTTKSGDGDCTNNVVFGSECEMYGKCLDQIVDKVNVGKELIHKKEQPKTSIQITDVLEEPSIIQISFCENQKSDDTLGSISETTDGSLSTARRLYERDTSNDLADTHNKYSLLACSSEQLDFAQFKAKFNSNVEALWNNSNSTTDSIIGNQSTVQSGVYNDSSIFNSLYKSEDIRSFWTNYYSHRYDIDKFKQLNGNESGDYSFTSMSHVKHVDMQKDYISMPIIGGKVGGSNNFDKLGGGKISGGKISPVGVFLQNTIWSDNPSINYTDTDESFFIKALTSASIQKTQDEIKTDTSDNEKYCFSFQTSKWSEGINGVPSQGNGNVTQQHIYQSQLQPLGITSSSSSSSISTMDNSTRSCPASEFIDSTSSSSSYIGCNNNWQIPTGNNLQADIKSWSSSNPTSLTELYASESFASIGKKSSYNFDMNPGPINVASTTSDLSTITLANHSTSNSGFIAYSRIKSYVKLTDTPISKWQKPEIDPQQVTSFDTPDDENLLTSERTHFHPIKMTYADGHTFEISNDLDAVDFKRSESGYLYLESEKYLEYTRLDILSEDDNSILSQYHNRLNSENSECVPSISYAKSLKSDFIIRFRLKATDKACQTETNCVHSSLVYEVNNMVKTNMQIDQADSDEDDCMDIGNCNENVKDNHRVENELDNIDQWSMVEIGKKCADNNNSSHTLWGMCPACNGNMKSIPANRMLKAELNIEGDEIMSDLRYMQELYIGDDWEYQNIVRDQDSDDDTDLDTETINDCELYQIVCTPPGYSEVELNHQQRDIFNNLNKLITDLLRPENAQSFASALGVMGAGCATGIDIGCFDAIRGAVGGNIHNDEIKGISNKNIKDEKYVGGLWNSEENIIWKKEFNPIDIFSHLNRNTKDKFFEKLNWEYSNLAEIWGKASPVNEAGLSTVEECSVEINRVEEKVQSKAIPAKTTAEDEDDIKIACKNIKNLLKSNAILNPDSNGSNFEINERRLSECKRHPGYYNSSKFKIFNRFERKRRHSASQNICFNNNSIYNKNNNVYHNNNLKFSLCSSAPDSPPIITVANVAPTILQSQITNKDIYFNFHGNLESFNYNVDQQKNNDQDNNDSQATVITCKYWTTMPSVISGSENKEPNICQSNSQTEAASFFMNKNMESIEGMPSISLNTSSILKHVTLVSRPLTR